MSFLFALLCAMVMFANISSSENRNSCSLNQSNVITFKKQIKACLKNLEKCIEDGIEFNLNEVDATTPSQSKLLVNLGLQSWVLKYFESNYSSKV